MSRDDLPSLALTLIQPWGSLIMLDLPDPKDVENRSWSPSAKQLPPGERFWIHAGMKLDHEIVQWAGFEVPGFAAHLAKPFPRGALLGHVRFERATPVRTSRWHASGQVGWYLADRVVLREPIPCRGAQGLWRVPEEALERIRAQEGRGS